MVPVTVREIQAKCVRCGMLAYWFDASFARNAKIGERSHAQTCQNKYCESRVMVVVAERMAEYK